jgi:hypothetical protein
VRRFWLPLLLEEAAQTAASEAGRTCAEPMKGKLGFVSFVE